MPIKQKRGVRWPWLGVPMGIMLVLWATSSLPATASTLGGIPMPKPLQKLAHVVAYGSLGAAWFWALDGGTWALALTTAYAGIDEVHQTSVPGRFGTPWDVALDSASAGMALVIMRRLRKRCEKRLQSYRFRNAER